LTGLRSPKTDFSSCTQAQDPFDASIQLHGEHLNQLEKPLQSLDMRLGSSKGTHDGPFNENSISVRRARDLPAAFSVYSDRMEGAEHATSASHHEVAIFGKHYGINKIDHPHRHQHFAMPTVDLPGSNNGPTPEDNRHLKSLRRCQSLRRLPMEPPASQSALETPPQQCGISGMSHVNPPRHQRQFNWYNVAEAESPSRPSRRRRQQILQSPNRNAMIITQFQSATISSNAHASKRKAVDITDAVVSALLAGFAPGDEDTDGFGNMADDEAITRKQSTCQRQGRRSPRGRSGRPLPDQEAAQKERQFSSLVQSKTRLGPDEGRISAPTCI